MESESKIEIKPTAANSTIITLLRSQSLPVDDLSDNSCVTLFAARASSIGVENLEDNECDECIVGLVGIERFNTSALLRSLVTDPKVRGKGYAKELVTFSENWSKQQGISKLFLLTTTADKFFSRLGYTSITRELAPPEIARSEQFSNLCPGSAVFMMKEL